MTLSDSISRDQTMLSVRCLRPYLLLTARPQLLILALVYIPTSSRNTTAQITVLKCGTLEIYRGSLLSLRRQADMAFPGGPCSAQVVKGFPMVAPLRCYWVRRSVCSAWPDVT